MYYKYSEKKKRKYDRWCHEINQIYLIDDVIKWIKLKTWNSKKRKSGLIKSI